MSEKTVWNIVRGILSLVALVFLGAIIFGDRSNCGIEKATLACRWTGSVADIFGTIIFLLSLIWASGLADKVSGKDFYSGVENKKGMGLAGPIGFVGAVIGMLLIWAK